MKKNKLIDAIGKVDDKYIKEAREKKKFVFDFSFIGKVATAALCLFLIIGVVPNLFGAAKSADQVAYTTEGAMEVSKAEEYSLKDENKNLVSPALAGDVAMGAPVDENKKLIVTGYLSVETLDFDKVFNSLEMNVKKYGGYIQNSSISTNERRFYNASIRIPANSYKDFLETIKGDVNVINYSENIDDITETYTDLEARLNSLKTEEAKVLEFYDKANSLEELMSVENRLTEIRYQIDSIETRIKNYDLLVDYSTLNIDIVETKVYTKTNDNFFSKLALNFVNGWSNFVNVIQDFVLGIVYNLWIVILIVAIIAAVIIYVKKKNKNK